MASPSPETTLSVQLQRTSELSFLVTVQTDHQGGSYRGGSANLYRRPSRRSLYERALCVLCSKRLSAKSPGMCVQGYFIPARFLPRF